MAISFFVQAFRKKGRRLVPDEAIRARSADEAIERCKRLARNREGVVAYSVEVDTEADFWGDPTILLKLGDTPFEFDQD